MSDLHPTLRRAFPGDGDGDPGGEDPGLEVDRRSFLKVGAAAAGGLLVAVRVPGLPPVAAGAAASPGAGAPPDGFQPNAYVRLDPDGAVTVIVPETEMGQGTHTALAMIVAEELEADWESVGVEQAPLAERYGDQSTGGSTSVRTRWRPLRKAGAAVRSLLVAAAASTWGVSASACRAERGGVVHVPSGRRLAYSALLEAAAELPLPEDPDLQDPEDFRIVGRPTTNLYAPEMVTGEAEYGADVRVPEMLFAAVARPPVFGGAVASFDATRARRVSGVQDVFEVPAVGEPYHARGGIAVVAENTWAALQGRDALDVEWDPGPHADASSEGFRREMRRLTAEPGIPVVAQGDPDSLIEEAPEEEKIHAEYELPFLAHAPMEPMNCTAKVDGKGCTLWCPTQIPGWDVEAVSEALGIPQERVTINQTLAGGGFGRRLNPDYSAEAALVAREAGSPVQVMWSREDDTRHDFYRPMAHHRVEARLDDAGRPLALRHRVATQPIGATYGSDAAEEHAEAETAGAYDMPYRCPNRSCEYAAVQSAVTRGWWRSVEHTHTAFAVESFVDELAAAAGADPFEYRRGLIDLSVEPDPDADFPFEPERLKRVLELAAAKADWGTPVPGGGARGIACHRSFYTYVAHVAEVSAGDDGLRVRRVVSAVDCGRVVNPDGARKQVEGGISDGLSVALGQEATLEGGRIREGNFDDYPLLRMPGAPGRIEVHLVDSDAEPTGLGEPGVPPIAPAVANAIYALTGERLRRLPFRTGDLTAAG